MKEKMELRELWKLSAPSTALLGSGVVFEKRLGREVALGFELESESGEPQLEWLVLEGVEAFKCTYGPACPEWVLQAYDRLMELPDSAWARELSLQLTKTGERSGSLRHLVIYFDDGPCYEVICRSFRVEK